MHMVRHHHPCKELISKAIEFEQRILHHSGHLLILQESASIAKVKIFFNSQSQESLLFTIERSQFLLPTLDNLSRDRICEIDGDELWSNDAIEMGEISTTMPSRRTQFRLMTILKQSRFGES